VRRIKLIVQEEKKTIEKPINTKVSIVKCKNYEEKNVMSAIQKALELIGGLKEIIKPNDKVLLKVNLLAPTIPEMAVTTHPIIVKSMIELVREVGGIPIIADSPGFLFAKGEKNEAIIKSGIKKIADVMGVEALQFETIERPFVEIDVLDGVWLNTIYAARLALEADVIISLPKLKTHGLTLYTGAVKNMFGTVASKTRKIAHNLAKIEKFSGALIDIYSSVKPKLSVMDAVVGMEGEGPRHGSPKQIGLIFASYDSVALDAVASKTIGYEPMDILTTKLATERGLGNGILDKIKILGENINDVFVDFEKSKGREGNFPAFITRFFLGIVKVEPRLIEKMCKKCGICVKSCPADAIKLDPYPVINRKLCIQCYCCNELCPEGAMEIRRSWLARRLGG
jgi:uncharacterized protein (DUF362 family)/NAD-dependent dihydropyrimidine dehydrogenase PreA subunit